jgi:hypothetical protein
MPTPEQIAGVGRENSNVLAAQREEAEAKRQERAAMIPKGVEDDRHGRRKMHVVEQSQPTTRNTTEPQKKVIPTGVTTMKAPAVELTAEHLKLLSKEPRRLPAPTKASQHARYVPPANKRNKSANP